MWRAPMRMTGIQAAAASPPLFAHAARSCRTPGIRIPSPWHGSRLIAHVDVATGQIIRSFIEDPDMRKNALPSPSENWTQLGTQFIWEHTEWLTVDAFSKYLINARYEWDSSHFKDTPGVQTDKRMRELVGLKAPFIALVNSKEEFQRLLDRQKLLEQVAQSLQNE